MNIPKNPGIATPDERRGMVRHAALTAMTARPVFAPIDYTELKRRLSEATAELAGHPVALDARTGNPTAEEKARAISVLRAHGVTLGDASALRWNKYTLAWSLS